MKTWQKWGVGLGAFLMWLGINAWAGHYAYEQGMEQGMKDVIGICYHIGGVLLDKDTGLVIQCSPLTQVPQQELDLFKEST